MSSPLGYDPAHFYIWRASDDFAIHLSLKVVSQLTALISRTGKEGQPREIRGILLGSNIALRAAVIEDFRLLPAAEDSADPHSEDALFEIACRMAEVGNDQRALGFFRCQRDGTLNMDQRDLETFSRLFCETGNVALLIQTSKRGDESDAALFYWQHGGAHPRDFGFGFPFEAGELANGHPGWRFPGPLKAPLPALLPRTEQKAPERTAVPPPKVSRAGGQGVRWSRLVPTIALVVIAVGAIQLATNGKQTVSAVDDNQAGLGLSVASREHQLEIRWNRQAAAIAASEKGVMKITDGATTESLPFDQDQLHDGFVAYTPTTNDVSIRLQVIGQDGSTTSESIRSVAIP